MAYKFNIGTFKVGGDLDMTSTTSVKYKDNSVENVDLTGKIQSNKLQGGVRPTKSITYNAQPADTNTIKIRYNGNNYVITITAGSGTDSASISSGNPRAATVYLGNHANADSTYQKVADLFNQHPDFACSQGSTGDSAGTITWTGDVAEGAGFTAWGGDSNNALPGTGVAASATTNAVDKFMKFGQGAGVVEQTLADFKTGMSLVKGDVGLANVDNVSESTIQSNMTKTHVGLSAVDNESKATMFTNPSLTGTVTVAGTVNTPASNVSMTLSPNGTGVVKVPDNYSGRSGVDADTLMPKEYIDSIAQGLDIKASVYAADNGGADLLMGAYNQNANPPTLTLSTTSGQNVNMRFDNEPCNVTGRRILIKGFSGGDRKKNGIYQVLTQAAIDRSRLRVTWAGSGSDDVGANDAGDITFVVDSKYYKITVTNNDAAVSAGFTSGTGADSGNAYTMTVGNQVGAGDDITELITAIVGNASGGLLHNGDGLANKSGREWAISNEGGTILQIQENSGAAVALAFSSMAAAGSDVSIAHRAFAVTTPGVLQRAPLAAMLGGLSDGAEPMSPGAFCFVERGSVNKDKGFTYTGDASLTANENSLLQDWTQFSAVSSLIGVTADAAELNRLDGALAGTAVASKAVIYDANKRISTDGLIVKTQELSGGGITGAINLANGAIIIFDAGGGNRSITLPQMNTIASGQKIILKRRDGATGNTITINKHGSSSNNTIEGGNSIILEAGAAVTLIADTNNGNGGNDKTFWII